MRIGNTDGGAVRLRGTPARAAPSIAAVPTGTRVEAPGSSERFEDLYWQRVRIPDGTEGWIAIDFLIPSDRIRACLTTARAADFLRRGHRIAAHLRP